MLDVPAEQRAAGAVSAATAELAASFGNRLVTSRAVREQHANITTWHMVAPPDVVVFPQKQRTFSERCVSARGIVCRSFRSAQELRSKVTPMRRSVVCRST
jgi:D-lactate dehydrogenase (cytochrome)